MPTAHHWGREIGRLGHDVRLFVKRQKNDTADAEAIAEAASRATMRFVAVKTEAQQARAMTLRARDLLVRQRTQLSNALRGHLAECGIVAAQGMFDLKRLQEMVEAFPPGLPPVVCEIGQMYLDQIALCSEKIAKLERALRLEAARCEVTARLQTMPGVGPITAMAVEAFAPPMASFRRGRDFAAWLGLVPRQMSTGGKQILGRTSKMGQRDIRRLLIVGAMAVVRAALTTGKLEEGSWLARMLAGKPRLVVAIALDTHARRSH